MGGTENSCKIGSDEEKEAFQGEIGNVDSASSEPVAIAGWVFHGQLTLMELE